MVLGDKILTASRDQTIKLWELSTGYVLRTFVGHSDWVKCVAVSLDGLYFASSGIDQSILIWQLSTGLKVQVAHIKIVDNYYAFQFFYSSPALQLT